MTRQRFLDPTASRRLDQVAVRQCLASLAAPLSISPQLPQVEQPSSPSPLGFLRLLKDEERKILEEQKKLKDETVSTTY